MNEHVNINEKNAAGLTPLLLAAMKGYTEIVATLLSYQVDIYTQNQFSCTPFFVAIISACEQNDQQMREAYFEIAKLLLIKEAQLRSGSDSSYKNYSLLKEMKNTIGLTPLEYLQISNSNFYNKLNILINDIESNPAKYSIYVNSNNKNAEPKEIRVSQTTSIKGGPNVRNRKRHLSPVSSISLSSDEENASLKINHSPPAKSTLFGSPKHKSVALDLELENQHLLENEVDCLVEYKKN